MTLKIEDFLDIVIADDALHCRWLNTLSMMENVGATKIVKSEHPIQVTETVLKHAAEETRHAYYLKRQINKIMPGSCPTYEPQYLINDRKSFRYLHKLDARISKLAGELLGVSGKELRRYAYILVTYAVEVRADEMYSQYQAKLKEAGSPVSVRGIIAEEEQHLAEMEAEISELFEEPELWKTFVQAIETKLYQDWLSGVSEIISNARIAA